MPEELKPLLDKIEALEAKVTSLEEENSKLKESIQRVTDLNRELLDRKGDGSSHGTDVASEKFKKFIEGE